MSDNLTVFSTNYTNVTGIKAKGTGNGTLTYIRPTGTKSISANGTGIDVTQYASVNVAVPSSAAPAIQPLTVTPTTVQQVFTSGNTLLGQQNCRGGATANWSMQLVDGVAYLVELSRCNSDGYVIQTYDPVEWVASTTETQLAPTSGSAYPIYVTTSTMRNAAQLTWIAKVYMSIDAYAPVTVNAIPSQYVVPTGTLEITANGTVDVTEYASASVSVPTGSTPSLQSKTATPMTSQQVITADSGYDGLSQVTVSAMPSGTAGTPTATKGSVSNHSVSVTPSVTNTTGYITGGTKNGTAVTVSASELVSGTYTVNSTGTKDVTNYASISVPSGSATAPSSITGTTATVSTGTNTLTLTKTVSVTPSVTAGYVSSGTAENSSVSLTANVTTKAAATITPSTTNQTIAAGTYLTGTQTIAGDADLIASNIISTANIFGVQGSIVLQSYYTGTSAPSSSLGQNGDIYIQQ